MSHLGFTEQEWEYADHWRDGLADRLAEKEMRMKWFIDGDQICITRDDFINLQESPAVFVDRDSTIGQTIEHDGIRGLAIGELIDIRNRLGQKTFIGQAISRDEHYDPADVIDEEGFSLL